MIISASRRTDIPAFYSDWFMRRVHEGFCVTVNPYNRKQTAMVSLRPDDVEAIVFWTKNAAPMLDKLDIIESKGLNFYFQYTLNDYPEWFEPRLPALPDRIETFRKLALMIGPEKVIWRYDPIIISSLTDYQYQRKAFRRLAGELAGSTQRVVISIVDMYRQAKTKFKQLAKQGCMLYSDYECPEFEQMVREMVASAQTRGMEIVSCAEPIDLSQYGVGAGCCIDAALIKRMFSLEIPNDKDTNQRGKCGCIKSKDIGFYDTCFYDCVYCYASSLQAANRSRGQHDINSPSLLGDYSVAPVAKPQDKQLPLF